jgi:geranylgeranyl transferase type-1 subunit beta
MSTGISPSAASASSPANLESKDNVELKFDSYASCAMLKKFLNAFPVQYQSLDPNRMTILYFTISGLDILGQIESISNKQAIIDWVYAQQVLPASDGDGEFHFSKC